MEFEVRLTVLVSFVALGLGLSAADSAAILKPNAMGWWCPIENGSMFTGEWLPALMAEGAGRKALECLGHSESDTVCQFGRSRQLTRG